MRIQRQTYLNFELLRRRYGLSMYRGVHDHNDIAAQ